MPPIAHRQLRLWTIPALAAITLAAFSNPAADLAQTGPGYNSAGDAASATRVVKPATELALTAVPEDFATLKLAAGFLLDVQVFDEPDLSARYRVAENGEITLPFVGSVHVEGCILAEAQHRIENALKSGEVLTNPQVTVNIVQYQPSIVTVLGEVASPGRLQLLAPHSLLDVISFAGGETGLAGSEVQVRHSEAGQAQTTAYHYGRNSDGELISAVVVHNGDTVIVPRAGIVYVLGAVSRPGGYLMQEDGRLNAAQALALAYGTTLLAKTRDIRILRQKADGTYMELPIDYQAMVSGGNPPPELQPRDIVYVPVSHLKATLTDATNIIGSTASAVIYTAR